MATTTTGMQSMNALSTSTLKRKKRQASAKALAFNGDAIVAELEQKKQNRLQQMCARLDEMIGDDQNRAELLAGAGVSEADLERASGNLEATYTLASKLVSHLEAERKAQENAAALLAEEEDQQQKPSKWKKKKAKEKERQRRESEEQHVNEASDAPPLAAMSDEEEMVSKQGGLDDDIPDEFICPITCELMIDPVMTVDGHTYERKAISEWLETHDTSPLTGEALPQKWLVPNLLIRTQIERLRKRP